MEQLRRLANLGTFSILQDKLDVWLSDYSINTCDQNVARVVEIIELNAKVQGQLFKLLSVCASEGGFYGGASALKLRLLPLLGQGFFASGISTDTSLGVLEDVSRKHRDFSDLQSAYDVSLDRLERDLTVKQVENEDLKVELEETKLEVDRIARQSTSEKMFNESEIRDLKNKLVSMQSDNERLRARLITSPDPVDRVIARSPSPVRTPVSFSTLGTSVVDGAPTSLSLARASSPLLIDDPTQRVRQQSLITRFMDLYAVNRLDAQDILRKFTGDYENIQRILYATLVDAFTVAKMHARDYRSRTRADLIRTHIGPDTLEEATQSFINRNVDLYDLSYMVQEVLRALRRNPRLFLPLDVDYDVITGFVREAVRLAFECSCLAHPLDIALSFDAELFDDLKYRRSYDSEYSAGLVAHHIWPALTQDGRVIVKGEACTRHGASLAANGGGLSTRSTLDQLDFGSASARQLPLGASPRSRSPYRTRSPSPGLRRSPSPVRSARATPSTVLSHYLN
jgi:hypothetical protein